jgi:hypothetical protein
MLHRARFATFLVCAFALGCAAEGSTDDGAPDTAPPPSTTSDAGPSVYDSGPPANPYGTPDAGSTPDGGTPPGDSGGGGDGAPQGGPCQNATDCPGSGKPNDSVTCTGSKCTFSCQGENYDVNADPTDGCEIVDAPLANHKQDQGIKVGSFSCTDGSSAQNIEGKLPSDARAHEGPAIEGFVTASGSAPDYFIIHASGGVCTNDVNLDLQMTNATQSGCYRLTVNTDKNGGQTCSVDATGHCGITNGSGSYGDGSDITVIVEKTCSSASNDNPTYKITGHL